MSDSVDSSISPSPMCQEVFAGLSEYIDGELPEAVCEAIRAHNGNCPPCEAFMETFTKTVKLIRAQPSEPLPPAVKNELAASLKRCREALGA